MATSKQKSNALVFLLISLLLILVSGCYAYTLYLKDERAKGNNVGLAEFLNGGQKVPSLKSILVGMSSGVVFGFIDNAGLFFGMDALDPFLPGGNLTKAGLGNTYSDALGSFLGTFIGYVILLKTQVNNSPIWADTLGIVIGCLFGILIPRMITGKS